MKRSLIILGIFALLLTGCHSSSEPTKPENILESSVSVSDTDDKYGGTLTICDMRTVSVIGYPAAMTSGSPIRHSAPALETLFQLDGDGSIKPNLAVFYKADMEEKTLTLTLQEDVFFHDGTPFDAEAVHWNLEQQIAAKATGTSHIIDFEVIDQLTLKILLSQWDNTLLYSLCHAQGLMISPTACEENGTEWAAANPVGTGPFIFDGREEDGTITYIKNENYWQEGKPYLDSIEIVCDNDSSSREYKFRQGTYNVLIRGDITSLAGFSAEGYQIHSIASTGPWSLIFDSADASSPFADLTVRQAVCHAIDRTYLVQSIYLDTVIATNQYAIPGMDSYNPQVAGYEYDLTKAKELMQTTPYAGGFTSTFTYDESADNADALAHALQDMLAKININLQLNPVSNAESTRLQLDGGGWDGIMGTFGSSQYDTLTQLYNYMYGSEKYSCMYKPEELISNISHALTANSDEYLDYVLDTQKLLVDEYCLCYYMFSNKDYTVLADNIHDTNFSSIMPTTLWTPADAWISKEVR